MQEGKILQMDTSDNIKSITGVAGGQISKCSVMDFLFYKEIANIDSKHFWLG